MPDTFPVPADASLFAWFLEAAELADTHPEQMMLIYPEQSSQFHCHRCGACCQQPWQIQISPDYYEQWYAVFDQHPSGRFRQPFVQLAAGHPPILRHQEGSTRCLFLEADNQCFIHRNYGAEAKPEVCQRYPHEASLSASLYSPLLKSSCLSAAQMLQRTGELLLRVVQRPAQFPPPGEAARLTLTQQVPAQRLLPWIGLLLEGLWQHSISPSRCLEGSLYGLKILLKNPTTLCDPSALARLYGEQVHHWRQDQSPPGLLPASSLDLFAALNPFPESEWNGFLKSLQARPDMHIPRQTRFQIRLREILRNYLTNRLLNFNPMQAQRLTLFQFVFLQAFCLLSVQLEALRQSWSQQRPLGTEQILQALMRVEVLLSQNPAWFSSHALAQYDEKTCLDAIQSACRLDLCLTRIP